MRDEIVAPPAGPLRIPIETTDPRTVNVSSPTSRERERIGGDNPLPFASRPTTLATRRRPSVASGFVHRAAYRVRGSFNASMALDDVSGSQYNGIRNWTMSLRTSRFVPCAFVDPDFRIPPQDPACHAFPSVNRPICG